jgi:hypothetical protein
MVPGRLPGSGLTEQIQPAASAVLGGGFWIVVPCGVRYVSPPSPSCCFLSGRQPSSMKFRSCLLVACMLVVPALAMFSHRIPRELRASARALVQRVLRTAGQGVGARRWCSSLAEEATSLQGGTGTADGGPGTAPSGGTPSPRGVEGDPRDQSEVHSRLVAAGAMAIECQPLPGVPGRHLASCRVALDPEGQLQRVFQAEAADPATAARDLLDQLAEWNDRRAARDRGLARQPEAPRF